MDTRLVGVACTVVVGLALVGLLVGFGEPARAWEPLPRAAPVPAVVLPAVAYADMNGKARGPNRAYVSDLRTLHAPQAAAPAAQTDADRQAALARRAARRAYPGAPPVIPHPVDANQVAACYQCHGEGRVIDGLVAPRISHQRFTNCTQCHAQAAKQTAPGDVPDLAIGNAFVAAASHGKGKRAYPGAPPQIPHPTHMRESCIACHGSLGQQGLQSSHPWRVNCTQCHVPSAELDQARFDPDSPPPWNP
jgi:cytochrome c-type protein NapB